MLANFVEAADEPRLSGPWNDLLPCYIARVHPNSRKSQRGGPSSEACLRELELRCLEYAAGNEEFGRALQRSRGVAATASPSLLGKVPALSPRSRDSLRNDG